jgi:hypothetical protein
MSEANKRKMRKAQSTIEYICACIVFAAVGIGTTFIMANRSVGSLAAQRQTDEVTSYTDYPAPAPDTLSEPDEFKDDSADQADSVDEAGARSRAEELDKTLNEPQEAAPGDIR